MLGVKLRQLVEAERAASPFGDNVTITVVGGAAYTSAAAAAVACCWNASDTTRVYSFAPSTPLYLVPTSPNTTETNSRGGSSSAGVFHAWEGYTASMMSVAMAGAGGVTRKVTLLLVPDANITLSASYEPLRASVQESPIDQDYYGTLDDELMIEITKDDRAWGSQDDDGEPEIEFDMSNLGRGR